MNSLLLPMLLLLPAAGAIVCGLLPVKAARAWALMVCLATFVISLVMAFEFQWGDASFQLKFNAFPLVFGDSRASFSLGVDSISVWLVLLTTFLTPLAVSTSFESIKDRPREYYAWMLLLLSAMLGVFVARDILVFYVFFELTLVPMFFIIGIWGGPDRRYAAGKFFLFTFGGSVFTLAGTIYLGYHAGSFDMTTAIDFARTSLTSTERFWILLAFLAGFSVKVPLFPVHTWLPLAHTEAPTAGSVILAGVLLKLGTYGLLRLALPIGMIASDGAVAFPGALKFLGSLCVIGVIYGALVAWVQMDIKKLVAYSSVSHLGFCVLGLLALNTIGIEGSVLYMVNHGLSTGAMFLVIGMIYDRYHTRDINKLSGLAKRMPVLAFFFILFTFSSVGLPGLNGFVSEFLTILGAFTSTHLGVWFGSFAALGIILGAVYMLHMAARVIWGPLMTPEVHDEHGAAGSHDATGHHEPGDINAREVAILVPLALAVIILGVYPSGLLRSLEGPVKLLQQPVSEAAQSAARERADYLAQMQPNHRVTVSAAVVPVEARAAVVP